MWRCVTFLGFFRALCALSFAMSVHMANAQDISVGQIGPFTGLPSPDAHEINKGAQAYFDSVNAAGGIKGRKISFFKLDDKFNGDEFAKQLEAASAQKPIALITPIGSAAMNKTLNDKLLDKYDFVIINAVPGADIFRNPGHPRLFHLRASDGQQIDRILRNASTVGLKKIHVFHQDLPIGTAGFAAAQRLAQGTGQVIQGTAAKDDSAQISAGAQKVVAIEPQGILVIGTPKFSAECIGSLRKAGFGGSIFTLSYVPPPLILKFAGEAARGVGIAKTFPNPNSASVRASRDMRAVMAQYAPDVKTYTDFHLEGFLSAKLLVEGLKRGGISPAGLVQGLKSLDRFDMGDFYVDFSKSNSGSSFVDIAVIGQGGSLRY